MTPDDGLARGKVDGAPIHVGDTVMIKAKVLKSIGGVGALLELFSKTDQMNVWVAEDHLRYALVDPELPEEYPDGTWLLADGSMFPDGNPRIFQRSDAEGHHDPNRRYDQCWFDIAGQQWIDWPAAVERGAARSGVRRMVVLAEDETELDTAALDEAMHACWLHGKWEWMTQKMSPEVREAAAAAVRRYHERLEPGAEAAPISTLRWWAGQ